MVSIASGSISEYDRSKLNELTTEIRGLPEMDRIVLMKQYNVLAENWDSPIERAKNLIDIQEYISNAPNTIPESQKQTLSQIIDELLVGQTNSTNEISVAIALIRNLIPENSPNYASIREKLDQIESHPTNIEENKKIGQEVLELVLNDPTIDDKYKLHIKNQFLVITSGGSNSAPAPEVTTSNTTSG